MSIRPSFTRLDAKLDGKSTKHYLWVRDAYGESKETAIDRYGQGRRISTDDVGYRSLWGDDFCESVDYKNYARKEDLTGYFDATKELRTWLDAPNGQSLGPPRLHPDFQESVRRHEEIKRRVSG
jgi:hypothetical protein